jgi:hypothetical protein
MSAGAPGGGTPAGYCRNCGTALTPETLREVQGVYYCPDCLAGMVSQAQGRPAGSSQAGLGSTARAKAAAALGIIPGLGAVYNGEYVKALIHVLVFAAIISLIDRAPGIFVPLLVAWIFYMPFEAYQTAKAKALQAAGAAQGGTASPGAAAFVAPTGGAVRRETIGPILLIAIGTLVLLDQWNLVNLDRVLDFWPLGLIALGVWLLLKRQE